MMRFVLRSGRNGTYTSRDRSVHRLRSSGTLDLGYFCPRILLSTGTSILIQIYIFRFFVLSLSCNYPEKTVTASYGRNTCVLFSPSCTLPLVSSQDEVIKTTFLTSFVTNCTGFQSYGELSTCCAFSSSNVST